MSAVRAAGVLHVRVRNGRKRYRFWSGLAERYVTEECSRTQALSFIKHAALKEIERLAEIEISSAEQRGTADGYSDSVDLAAPWRAERCPKHGEVHHEFVTGGFDGKPDRPLCRRCGSPPEAVIHLPCTLGRSRP